MPSQSAPARSRPLSKAGTSEPAAQPAPGEAPEKVAKIGAPRKRGSLREDARRRIRERLISAALTAFAEQGYTGTSIERIVEIADTTAPTFYRHFTSKRDMLEPLRERLTSEVRAVFLRLDTTKVQTPDTIKMWLRDYIEMWRCQRKLCEAHWEAAAADAEFGAGTMSAALFVADDLKKLLSRFPGGLAGTVRLRLAMIMVLLDRVVHLARDEPDEALAELILDQFAEMFWLSIYSDSARAHMQSGAKSGLPYLATGEGARKAPESETLTKLVKR